MRRMVVAGLVVFFAMHLQANSQLIPLVELSDPVLITSAALEEGVPPMMTLELENETAFPIETRNVWLNRARFYTQTEFTESRKAWDCSMTSAASLDQPSAVIPPGQRVTVRVVLTKSCDYTPAHEHFFVHVTRITRVVEGAPLESVWKRESKDFARLLTTAQPHP